MNSDLSPYLNRLDILNDTAQQIIKDFGMTSVLILTTRFAGDYGVMQSGGSADQLKEYRENTLKAYEK